MLPLGKVIFSEMVTVKEPVGLQIAIILFYYKYDIKTKNVIIINL